MNGEIYHIHGSEDSIKLDVNSFQIDLYKLMAIPTKNLAVFVIETNKLVLSCRNAKKVER